MRALTLTQPWCGLVASGIKLVENRPRSMIRPEDFGVPFALHASRVVDSDVVSSIRTIAPEIFEGDADKTDEEFLAYVPEWMRLGAIRSAVIGVATIERAVRRDATHLHIVRDYHTNEIVDLMGQARWLVGRVGYVLRDVRALATPVPCRGRQGFWTLPDDIERAVTAQIASAS